MFQPHKNEMFCCNCCERGHRVYWSSTYIKTNSFVLIETRHLCEPSRFSDLWGVLSGLELVLDVQMNSMYNSKQLARLHRKESVVTLEVPQFLLADKRAAHTTVINPLSRRRRKEAACLQCHWPGNHLQPSSYKHSAQEVKCSHINYQRARTV